MPIKLTFAELAYLLRDADPSASERLHLLSWKPEHPVTLSGAGSLYVRELLEPGAGEPALDASLAPVLEAIQQPSAWIEIGFATEDGAAGIQMFDGTDARVVVTTLPFASFEIDTVENAGPFADTATRVVADFLAEPGNRAVYLAAPPAESDSGLAVRRQADGTTHLAIGADEEGVVEIDLDDALARVSAYFEEAAGTHSP